MGLKTDFHLNAVSVQSPHSPFSYFKTFSKYLIHYFITWKESQLTIKWRGGNTISFLVISIKDVQ